MTKIYIYCERPNITDNTTVAFEVLHEMRNKRTGKKGYGY